MLSTPNITWHQDIRITPFQATLQLFKATAPYDSSFLIELSLFLLTVSPKLNEIYFQLALLGSWHHA